MKKTLTFVVCLAFLSFSCRKSGIADNTPECISDEIKNNRHKPDWYYNQVDEYEFQGQVVYAFEPDESRVADASTPIRDASCNTLCDVGGYGGPDIMLCNGVNFYQTATLKRTIWKK